MAAVISAAPTLFTTIGYTFSVNMSAVLRQASTACIH